MRAKLVEAFPLTDEHETASGPQKKELTMAARATIELFGNGAIAKTKERLAEVEAEGSKDSIQYWRALLEEVTRLHSLRHSY